jgi:hypothetical protein
MTRSRGLRHKQSTPSLEALEERQLLSFYSGVSSVRPVIAGGAIYQLTVTGGGYERVGFNRQGLQLNLLGTTNASTFSVSLMRVLPHSRQTPLKIAGIKVESGQLGNIQAQGTANLVGPITPLGNVNAIAFNSILGNAQINIAGNLGGLTAGTIALGPSGAINVGGNLTGAFDAGAIALNSGSITIGNDATAPIAATSITLAHNATLGVGRDDTGGIAVANDVTLDSGGTLKVGRELAGLSINGNLVVTPTGGAVSVGGDLMNLVVNGVIEGNGTARPDLNVGLNLNSLSVLGGQPDAGGIEHASIAVAKSIDGFNVPHGVFNSLITAGVTINGQSGPGQSPNIGPDGTDAIFDSELRAGADIVNFLIGGDVTSDYVTNPNPTGYRTRIIAGETPQGQFVPGGLIDNVQITGSMTDSVLAASVAPYGGTGTLPAVGYNASYTPPIPPGDGGANTYDQPAGVIRGRVVGATVSYPNYSEVSYYNERPTGVAYNAADPTIDDAILGGAINPSFASAPLAASALTPGAALPLPTQSTVLGGVVSNPHGDNQDYAGIFAADTSGVFVGKPPSSSGP